MRTRIVLAVVGALIVSGSVVSADPDAWMNPPAAPNGTAESKVNEGFALAKKGDWPGAEGAFRAAIRLRAEFPEAWNGLGHALRNQKRYDESVKSYQEALRLRPTYPQALEYLGEAYIQMGKLEDAKAVLERLRSLDPREADELAAAIAEAGK